MKKGKILLVTLLVLTVSFLAFTTFSFAENKGEEKSVSGKAMEKPIESLKYKNIMGDLGAEYHYLADIGEMIDKGRDHKDGNTLIAAALLMLYAEKDSGKKSSVITGEALLKETVELAGEQKNAKLAMKIADVYEDATFGLGDKKVASDLRKKAKEYEAASSQRAGAGTVIINNDTPYYIRVYVEGYDRGILYSGNVGWVTGVSAGSILLYGYAPYTDYEWGPTTGYLSAGGTYTWNLIFTD
ncbi:hypothetical protein KAX75_11715 [candidate division WOR-3 bacterium]|nr:hypothetical protein [candidate division WOR-3 bacterium]